MRINATVSVDLPIRLDELCARLLTSMDPIKNAKVTHVKGIDADLRDGTPNKLVLTIHGEETDIDLDESLDEVDKSWDKAMGRLYGGEDKR